MAIQRLVDCAITGRTFTLFGDGSQIRDFTFVKDVVEANVLAGLSNEPPGQVYNVAGGSSVSMRELIDIVSSVSGRPVQLEQTEEQAGDVVRTGGDFSRARASLGWSAKTSLEEGVGHQVEWWSRARVDGMQL